MIKSLTSAAVLLFTLSSALPAIAADDVASLPTKPVLTLQLAKKIAAAAAAEADKNSWPSVIAIVDDGGWPLYLERMNNTQVTASALIAPEKARTAALFKRPSADLENAINNGRPAAITAPGFVMMEGGLPIVVNGNVIGAIGVSGGTKAQDSQIAKAGLEALKH